MGLVSEALLVPYDPHLNPSPHPKPNHGGQGAGLYTTWPELGRACSMGSLGRPRPHFATRLTPMQQAPPSWMRSTLGALR